MLNFFNPYQICIKIRVLVSKFHHFNFPHHLVLFSCFGLEHIPTNSKSISKSRFALIKVFKKINLYKLYQNLEFVSKWYWVDSLRNSSNLNLSLISKLYQNWFLCWKWYWNELNPFLMPCIKKWDWGLTLIWRVFVEILIPRFACRGIEVEFDTIHKLEEVSKFCIFDFDKTFLVSKFIEPFRHWFWLLKCMHYIFFSSISTIGFFLVFVHL